MRVLALLILLCYATAAPAFQPAPVPPPAERILLYDSDVRINRDGSLDVVETIRVNATGDQIRHGIYRRFPLAREDGDRTVTVSFEPVDVTRNGRPERWRVERDGTGATLWIGDPDALVSPGRQSYRIHYRTTGHVAGHADFDALYWDATGYEWPFQIDNATVRLRLPEAVRFTDSQYLSGPRDGTVLRAALIAERPGDITVGTTQPLRQGEGLTITVTWRKGVVRAR